MSSIRAPYSPDEVDPGLDREGHPLAKRLAVAGDDVRVLVAFEPDAVPGSVEERVAVALCLDRTPRRGVDLFGRDTRPNRTRRRRLGAVQDAEEMAETLVRALPGVAAGDPQRSRDVGAVAVDRAADVEDDRFAGLDDTVGSAVVGRRRIGPRPDDREGRLVMALGDETFSDFVRDVLLGATDESSSGDRGHDPVRGARGTAERLDLVAVLDDAQRREASAMRARPASGIRAAGSAGDVARQGRPRQRGAAPALERRRSRHGRQPRRCGPSSPPRRTRRHPLPRSRRRDRRRRQPDTIWRASPRGVARRGQGHPEPG